MSLSLNTTAPSSSGSNVLRDALGVAVVAPRNQHQARQVNVATRPCYIYRFGHPGFRCLYSPRGHQHHPAVAALVSEFRLGVYWRDFVSLNLQYEICSPAEQTHQYLSRKVTLPALASRLDRLSVLHFYGIQCSASSIPAMKGAMLEHVGETVLHETSTAGLMLNKMTACSADALQSIVASQRGRSHRGNIHRLTHGPSQQPVHISQSELAS